MMYDQTTTGWTTAVVTDEVTGTVVDTYVQAAVPSAKIDLDISKVPKPRMTKQDKRAMFKLADQFHSRRLRQ